MISVPHLKLKPSGYLAFCFIPGEDGLLAGYHYPLFGLQIIERIYEAPVKVAFASQRAVMNVCALTVVGAFHPSELNKYTWY